MEEMLLHTDNTEAATAEIESVGGRVIIQMGNDLLVAKVPRDFIAKKKNFASASAHISALASPDTLTYVQAYWMAREKKTRPQPQIQSWTEKTAPVVLPRESPFFYEANSPYRQTLTGKIAFNAIVVSGPGHLAISNAEKNKILSEVTAGFQFWADAAPASADLQFLIYSAPVSINAADNFFCPNYEACHDVFANPALQYLGFSAGKAGNDQAAHYIKDQSGADGAYIGFFSKYTQKHFAYSYFGGGPLYMQYSNDGWGPDQIDRVFAHESGHVFNAPDEYSECKCYKRYGKGNCAERNGNCKDCTFYGSQSSCIMSSNDFNVCSYTKNHLGWCQY